MRTAQAVKRAFSYDKMNVLTVDGRSDGLRLIRLGPDYSAVQALGSEAKYCYDVRFGTAPHDKSVGLVDLYEYKVKDMAGMDDFYQLLIRDGASPQDTYVELSLWYNEKYVSPSHAKIGNRAEYAIFDTLLKHPTIQDFTWAFVFLDSINKPGFADFKKKYGFKMADGYSWSEEDNLLQYYTNFQPISSPRASALVAYLEGRPNLNLGVIELQEAVRKLNTRDASFLQNALAVNDSGLVDLLSGRIVDEYLRHTFQVSVYDAQQTLAQLSGMLHEQGK